LKLTPWGPPRSRGRQAAQLAHVFDGRHRQRSELVNIGFERHGNAPFYKGHLVSPTPIL